MTVELGLFWFALLIVGLMAYGTGLQARKAAAENVSLKAALKNAEEAAKSERKAAAEEQGRALAEAREAQAANAALNAEILAAHRELEQLKATNADLAARIPAPKRRTTADERKTLIEHKCIHCGGVHTIACPRVKRLRFRPDGLTPSEVEFFPDGDWPKDHIVWIDDLFEEQDAEGSSLPATSPAP